MNLRKKHTCQVRKTTSIMAGLCGAPATQVRLGTHLWVCDEHQVWGADREPVQTPMGVWPADRRRWREFAGVER